MKNAASLCVFLRATAAFALAGGFDDFGYCSSIINAHAITGCRVVIVGMGNIGVNGADSASRRRGLWKERIAVKVRH